MHFEFLCSFIAGQTLVRFFQMVFDCGRNYGLKGEKRCNHSIAFGWKTDRKDSKGARTFECEQAIRQALHRGWLF